MIIHGDSIKELKALKDDSVDCIITSPPYYGLRDYGAKGQIGAERTFDQYVDKLLALTAELKRVLKPTGTFWWNHGDSYGGSGKGGGSKNGWKGGSSKYANVSSGAPKSLLLQAHRLVIRMMDEQGWILRNQVIWHKPNVMPASVKDRFTVDFEPIFFFTKTPDYYFEQQREPLATSSIERVKHGWKSKKANGAIMNGKGIDIERMGERFANPLGRNKRSVWKIPTSASRTAHVAMFPEALVEPMISAGCPRGGVVLDPFFGSGTTGVVAKRLGREFIGIELNPAYIKIAETRLSNTQLQLAA